MLIEPATTSFDLLEHGAGEDFVGPNQRMTRALTNEEVGADQGSRVVWDASLPDLEKRF